jgi:hypothetical protein
MHGVDDNAVAIENDQHVAFDERVGVVRSRFMGANRTRIGRCRRERSLAASPGHREHPSNRDIIPL